MSSEKRRIPLLMDEPPIIVYPSLARVVGINKAVIIQQVHFLLNSSKVSNNQYNHVDGKWWVYNSYKEWLEYFPWLSVGGLKRMFIELERDGFISSMQSVKNKSDRRKWYTLNYDEWLQNVTTMSAKCDDGSLVQNVPMVETKRDDGYSETTTEKENDSAPISAGNIIALDEEPTPPTKTTNTRKADPIYDAIAAVWKTSAGGYVGNMKGMFTGTAKKGQWKMCAVNPPVVDASEILRFGEWAKIEMRRKNLKEMPTACVTIQRWFYDFRADEQRKANRKDTDYVPVEERTSALHGVKLVS